MNKEFEHIRKIETTKSGKKRRYEPLRPIGKQEKPNKCLEIPTRLIPYFLEICKTGDGLSYQNYVFTALVKILGGIIDHDLARQNISIEGGVADIELPFCIEMLPEYPYWMIWQRDFGIKTILAEVKNLKGKATYEHVNQLKGYVDANKKGKLAFLVSRNGFTDKALITLKSYSYNNYLILPLENDDLRDLIKLSLDSPLKVMRYLRRKEELLMRIK